jgi:hypothetical protein
MGTRASPLFAATILIAVSTSCGETSVTRFETVEAARRQGLFDRGWVPDVLPAAAGPLTEAHNIDTNTRCAYGQFAPLAFEAVEAALSKAGFEPNGGYLAAHSLRSMQLYSRGCGKDLIAITSIR